MATFYKTDGTTEEVTPANGKCFSLSELQGFVDGYIERVSISPEQMMFVNEEGKIQRLPFNHKATYRLWMMNRAWTGEILVGNVILVSSQEMQEDEPEDEEVEEELVPYLSKQFVELTRLDNGNLKMEIIDGAKPSIQEIAEKDYLDADSKLEMVIEYYLENGWSMLAPESVGSLTDGPIIAYDVVWDDEGEDIIAVDKVYWYSDYQEKDPVIELLLHGSIIWEGHVMTRSEE